MPQLLDDPELSVHVRLVGTSGLVMHNIQLADTQNPVTREIAEIASKRKKTDQDREEISRLEFIGGLYYDEVVGIYIPSWNVRRCFEQAAKVTRLGTALMRALMIPTDKLPLTYKGPRRPEELALRQEFVHRAQVGVQSSSVSRTRPIFREWVLEFDCALMRDVMDPSDLTGIIARAGRIEGLGDARKLGYGRFSSEVTASGK